ncbi:voltage-dependent calcium channel subunit alpha-2/delta-3 isoform X2 [Cimex lectularius]|uniref:VWFA domain-containing protein n=1 Tax=Cimex lectularius TaxID=79782 RepID=A0A8I6STT8_CIMLE|nr:voltage-dependent calcium channel subunit alpha-2/delta-3 isoform X2 [Cimex lectularius]
MKPHYKTLFLIYLSLFQGQAFITKEIVESWVSKLGTELWHFGDHVTRRNKVQESFREAKIEVREGNKLVRELAQEIKNMMDLKISAVRRIMDTAENSAMASQAEGSVPLDYQYYNSKNLEPLLKATGKEQFRKEELNDPNKLIVTPNSHFFNIPVNTSVSSVHVPTNVYDRAPDVIHGIKWSANLDDIFIGNYKEDPSLSWQYFGSSSGFMRQFPAMKWEQVPPSPVDLYDCRTRSWYIEAATSSKDLLILVDNSGSMMGQRKEIARHVVNNILDTLGNNDFVNIMTFVKDTIEVVPCFKDKLVQANLENIRELKMGMENMEPASNIANFTVALTKAFELLQEYREQKLGAACNQAIMLVTDGVPYNFKEIFEEYNWKKTPPMPVRVFTYLIGKEVADVREVKWMACANQGYYVHLSSMAEVREQVLQYVPVMARPMVLLKTEHPIIWTPLYADVTDPKMTDWLWEMKERKKQKERSQSFRYHKGRYDEEEEQRLARKQQHQLLTENLHPYKFMTSISMPVYDRRENANLTERVLINEAFWVLRTRETKVANLLGVAGTDVPNSDIQRLIAQHLLGVNAYAFIVTNNGYILIHPDLRPVFDGILKPSYNNIDITDVEIMDDNSSPRNYSSSLLQFREKLIYQSNGSESFPVKYHYDGLRRVYRGIRSYYYNVIVGTPFELVVALPVGYGQLKVEGQVEIKRLSTVRGSKPEEFFKVKNWKIHPDWFYCKYHYGDVHNFKTPEDELLHFLLRSTSQKWKWPLQRNSSPPEHQGNISKSDSMDRTSYFCDRTLFLSLVYDAKVTNWFSGNISLPTAEEKGEEMKQRFGISLVFLATRSGLTRWQDLSTNSENEGENKNKHFSEIHNRAVDETWYKRAVEHYVNDKHNNRQIFVYSVPFDAGDENDTLVTATHAVFIKDNAREAPAAVVGYQFLQSSLHALFKNITSTCDRCEKTCANSDLDCYVLDNNGYVIVSEDRKDTGKFFGELKENVMTDLVKDEVYRRIEMYDYQAVCFRNNRQEPSNSNRLYTPLNYMFWIMNWFITQLIWLSMQTEIHGFIQYALSQPIEEDLDGMISETFDESSEPANMEHTIKSNERLATKMMINKTQPQPCDMQVGLYSLEPFQKWKVNHHRNCRPYVVQLINCSNLVMVVVNRLCKIEDKRIDSLPTEIIYNSTSLSCHKVLFNKLPRRRPKKCTNSHPKEKDIKLCGRSSLLQPHKLLSGLQIIFLLSYWTFA